METFKKRKDCFFGLHFDFHAAPNIAGIGSQTDAKKIGTYLDAVKPDFNVILATIIGTIEY